MSLSMLWPILLALVSEIAYQICAKSMPEGVSPLASLSVTYVVGAAVSAVLFYALNRGGSLLHELSQLNWSPFALGVAIVGLEMGSIYMYKVGWTVSTGPLVKCVCVMAALTLVGVLIYREVLTPSKVVGIVICLVGLYFINR